VQLDTLLVSQPNHGEEAMQITEMLVKSNAVDVIVIDSVAALVPRAELEGEIGDSISSTSQRIIDVGEKAALQIQQQVDNIDTQLNRLFKDTLRVGEIVGEMQQIVKKGENAGQGLKDFLEEARGRLGAK